MTITSDVTQKDTPYYGVLPLRDPLTNQPLTENDLQTTHTRKLHLFVVDKCLRDYQHVHPVETEQEGVYAFTFTPHTNQPYSVWGEFTRTNDNTPERIHLDLPHEPSISVIAGFIPSNTAQAGNIKAEWIESSEQPLQQGQVVEVQVRLTDLAENPITQLDDIMGAKGHMAGFSVDGNHFIHAHPLETDDASCLRFHIQPEHAGMTRFFLQVQQDGQELYLPFTRMIKSAEKFTDLSTLQHDQHIMCR